MATNAPFAYELSPRVLEKGMRWLTVTLENTSPATLSGLNVALNSLDEYSIEILTEGAFLPVLDPGGEEVIPMQVSAHLSGSVYITVEGEREDESFHWESPDITLTVGEAGAELVSFLAVTEPGDAVGGVIRCEATVRGCLETEGLSLDFWAQTPAGTFDELASVETGSLSPGEEARYSVEVETDEPGTYQIYAYLFDGTTRLGREVERIRVH